MFSLDEKAYILLEVLDLTYSKKREVISLFDEPKDIFTKFEHYKLELSKILGETDYQNALQIADETVVNNYIKNIEKEGITIITSCSPSYPQKLLECCSDYPFVFYAKGDVSLLNKKCFGVVGTRKITRYGKTVTKQFTEKLCNSGLVIVSGMADGVDTVAHRTTLDCNQKTIAVLGSGFNHVYPKTNFSLFNEIVEKGLVITEYKPNTKPNIYTFPVRNRIIAGLSCGVLITEAGMKSGAMHTKNYAVDYNVNLYAVPGNIDNFNSSGCNMILKSCQASLVVCAEDILEDLNILTTQTQVIKPSYQLSLEEQLIVNTIGAEEMHLDELVNITKLDTKELLRYLTIMEINGIIEKLCGNFYRNINYQQ